MPDIYDEALADKKRLLEVAEENAIRRITAAYTPKIKELIERQLASDVADDVDGDRDVLLDLADETEAGSTPGLPPQDTAVNVQAEPVSVTPVVGSPAEVGSTPDVGAGEPAEISLPGDDGKVTLDLDSLQGQVGQVSEPPVPEEDAYELTGESVHALRALLGQVDVNPDRIELRCIKMREAIDHIVEVKNKGIDTIKNQEVARQIKLECERLYRQIKDSGQGLSESVSVRLQDKLESVYSVVMEHYSVAGHLAKIVGQIKDINRDAGKLNKLNESMTADGFKKHVIACFKMMHTLKGLHESINCLSESVAADDTVDDASVKKAAVALGKLYKEIRQMAGKNGKLVNEHEVMLRLSLPDELEVEPEDIDVTVVEAEPEDDGIPGEEGPSDMDMDDLDLDVGGMEGGEEEDLEGYMPEEDYLLQIDLPGDEEVATDDVDVSVADDEMSGEEALGDEEETEMGESVLRDDDVVEIDEAALVQEMKRMKALREEKYKIQHGGHGPDHFDAFGGGKEEGESFVDGEDLNQSDEAGGSEGYLEESDGLSELDEIEETDSEDDEEEVEESKKPGKKNAKQVKEGKQLAGGDLRAKLAESKLLNVKLVALNRLLQVPGLKAKDKDQIVEALDKGKSSDEVERLYKKIVDALKKRASRVNESADGTQVLGSSSRPTTTSSPTAESQSDPLLERWAKIAGTDVLKD